MAVLLKSVGRDYSFDVSRGLFLPGAHVDDAREILYQAKPLREQAAEKAWHSQAERDRYVDRETGMPRIGGGSVSAAYSVVGGTAFSIATATKTALNAIAPAGHGLALTEFAVSMDGVTGTAVPATVDVCQSTQATAGTSGVSPTITQVRGRATGGSAPTGGSNYSAEPTTLTVVKKFYVSQFMGTFIYQAPLGREIECDSSGGTVKALAIRVTTTATVNVLTYVEVEAVG